MKRTLKANFRRTFAVAALLMALTLPILGQSDSLVLSSGTAASNGSVALNLNVTSPAGSEPSALQWTLTYSSSSVVSISATAASAATAAGKSLTCSSAAGSYTCLLTG